MLAIKSRDLVLEIGSGNRPRPRSNILVDRYPADSTERAGGEAVQIDSRPFVVADGMALPFKDKSFDYVITSHTLEHVPDPRKFVSELMRVARAGYIETPSELSEKLFGWPFHRWVVRLESGTIVMRPRRESSPFGNYFHAEYAGDSFFREFVDSHGDDFVVKYEWEGTVPLRIEGDDDPAVRFNTRSTSVRHGTPLERAGLAVVRFFLKKLLVVAHHFRKFHH